MALRLLLPGSTELAERCNPAEGEEPPYSCHNQPSTGVRAPLQLNQKDKIDTSTKKNKDVQQNKEIPEKDGKRKSWKILEFIHFVSMLLCPSGPLQP